MSNNHWQKQGQDQARKGYVAPTYTAPRPSWQERQATQAAFNQARTQYGTNHSSNGGKKS